MKSLMDTANELMADDIKEIMDGEILGDMEIMKKMQAWCEEKGSPYFQRRDLIRVCGISEEKADKVLHDAVRTWAVHKKGSSWYSTVTLREKVEGYLSGKWGIDLAADHPFANQKPEEFKNEVEAGTVARVKGDQLVVEAIVCQ